jgi:hypothetical protein
MPAYKAGFIDELARCADERKRQGCMPDIKWPQNRPPICGVLHVDFPARIGGSDDT